MEKMEEMVRKEVNRILEGTGGILNDNDTVIFNADVPLNLINDVAVKINAAGIIIEGIERIDDKVLISLKTTSAPNSTMTTQQIIDAVKA